MMLTIEFNESFDYDNKVVVEGRWFDVVQIYLGIVTFIHKT
jgi:hypothetical protein